MDDAAASPRLPLRLGGVAYRGRPGAAAGGTLAAYGSIHLATASDPDGSAICCDECTEARRAALVLRSEGLQLLQRPRRPAWATTKEPPAVPDPR